MAGPHNHIVIDWDGQRRRDGTRVELIADTGNYRGGYQIVPPDGGDPISECPCCAHKLPTVRVAKLVANRLFPLPPPYEETPT